MLVSRTTWVPRSPGCARVGYGTHTRSGAAFKPTSPTPHRPRRPGHRSRTRPHNPRSTTDGPLTWTGFRLNPFRSPLLGVSQLLSSRPGTEMFQFPGCPPIPYEFGDGCPDLIGAGCPIRKSPDQGLRAAPRCIAWLATSFIGTGSQSIHRMP